VRRLLVPLAILAALVSALPAAAELRPVRRDFGELQVPRVRAGTIVVPAGQALGRITVLVRLADPPLAEAGRTFYARGATRRLDVRAGSSRTYLQRLVRAQRRATAQLLQTIPEARVDRSYRIVLNALSVRLPATALPTLVRQPYVRNVYPSLRYRLALDDSPAVIGADTLAALTGARGEGIKIGVVDDGIDQRSTFFSPAGLSYPRGFPKGARAYTTPKVIVARSFPGPGAGKAGRLPVDRKVSFHGTHVAGIASGIAGTTAPSGADHPRVTGLSGVAPRAYIGNYRVFTVPSPIGHVANTPEIVAAFEAAVADGMDVINFSGGGPEAEPINDALIEAVRNVSAAGVVPVISAGNDRDEFGPGSAGSPGTAPDAISVAAVSNAQVFSPVLTVEGDAPAELKRIPFRPTPGAAVPLRLRTGQTLVDVGTIVGRDGKPVDRRLCGPARNPNGGRTPLRAGSLRGLVALVSRGSCTFVSKAGRARAAGAIAMVVVDNRPGEANGIPIQLVLPGGMISDFDGRRLRELVLARIGGRAKIGLGRRPEGLETGRPGVVTSFSSAGPTSFGHQLKPDLSAPGGQILSSTLSSAGGPFAVFDGTSMSAPHVAGAAALLLQRHPAWTPAQVKSALMGTAIAAWADTARTVEAPVVLGGAGLVNLPRADDPMIFADPASVSFGDLNVNRDAQRKAIYVRVADAGNGGGGWSVELRPQRATAGASLDLPATIDILPAGESALQVVARVQARAEEGENYGFIVLRKGDVTRRIPYLFIVTRPALETVRAVRLKRFQTGSTLGAGSRVDAYRYPAAPFGPPPDYVGPSMRQDGRERLYVTRLNAPAVNFGVSVIVSSPGSFIDPWVLGSRDEQDVQGYAGTPINVNSLTFGYRADVGAAGASYPRPRAYYVAVDSGRDPFTGRRLGGRYVLQSWVNDVSPPFILPITRTVSAGRPTLVARVVDGLLEPGSGVDPLSLAISYRGILVGAAAYDPASAIAVFPLPATAPRLRAGRLPAVIVASDYQETKNVNTGGSENLLPNTAFQGVRLRVVRRPTVAWIAPEVRACVARRERLAIVAGSPVRVRSVRFFDGERRIATVRRGVAGIYGANWRTGGLKRGRHVLRAVVRDASGKTAVTTRAVRVCR